MQKNIYQKIAVSSEQVVNSISCSPEKSPKIILLLSTVRSGTTAFLRIFAAGGIPSHFQRVKNILRWLMQGGEDHWQFPEKSSSETILLKEALGPYTELECTFNPLQVLLDLGLTAEKIHLVILGRSPLQTWASWNNLWQTDTCVDRFIQAYESVDKIRLQAKKEGVPTTCVVYEAFQESDTEQIMKRLLERLGLQYSFSMIQGWDKLSSFSCTGSNIFFPEEPEAFRMPSGLVRVRESTCFQYVSREKDVARLSSSDVTKINRSRLLDIYRLFSKKCRDDLSLL